MIHHSFLDLPACIKRIFRDEHPETLVHRTGSGDTERIHDAVAADVAWNALIFQGSSYHVCVYPARKRGQGDKTNIFGIVHSLTPASI